MTELYRTSISDTSNIQGRCTYRLASVDLKLRPVPKKAYLSDDFLQNGCEIETGPTIR